MRLLPIALVATILPVALGQAPGGGNEQFDRGQALFDRAFHIVDGLGAPQMNADSCRACHRDPAMGGAGPLELNVSRFARDNSGVGPFENLPGGQGLSKLFPPRLVAGESTTVTAMTLQEAGAGWTVNEWAGATVRDTTSSSIAIVASNDSDTLTFTLGWSAVAPPTPGHYTIALGSGREEYPLGFGAGSADCFEQRQTPSIFGDGLIDQIAGVVITANEDPTDANGDGVFGLARRIDVNGTIEIGRFGWKAQVPRLADFVNDAMMGEMGMTTPDNGRGFAGLSDADSIADPEVTQQQVDDIAFFMQSLPAPQRGGSTDMRVVKGAQFFSSVGCAKCHVPELPGLNGPVPLYSNLLLHDVMPTDYRGMAEPGAGIGMFRTPPLWGIKDTAPYMHDGRAEDLRGAILAHFSEAEQVRQNFEALTVQGQEALILFLEDL